MRHENDLAQASAVSGLGRFFTVSNLLSICRAVLAVPFAMVMLSDIPDKTLWGILILAVAALTDKLDGALARKYNEITEWGKILDPLADKIGIGVVAVVLVMLGLVPLWFVLVLFGRDLLILAGGLYLKKYTSIVPQSNLLGKWTIGILALMMVCALMEWSIATEIFLWTSVAMLVASLGMYLSRFLEIVKASSSPSTK
ncbi:MAG: CDP-alcohol phosphatidyltransferase family protein [Bacteroidetes bacterium]|nr:CDP-alcohol phosphatidyltransferase family protein [Bacteroidota bacterium]MCW5897006.1 CDP-alcohol phosphatidyltransferase family protein [Bacteroidota bacterium]